MLFVASSTSISKQLINDHHHDDDVDVVNDDDDVQSTKKLQPHVMRSRAWQSNACSRGSRGCGGSGGRRGSRVATDIYAAPNGI